MCTFRESISFFVVWSIRNIQRRFKSEVQQCSIDGMAE